MTLYEQIFNWVEVHFRIFSKVVLFGLIIGTIILSRIKREPIKKAIIRGFSIGYAFLLYMLTLGIRARGKQSKLVLEVREITFDFSRWCFSGLIWGDFANFLLFMPYGILFYMAKKKERRFISCMVSIGGVSAGIEILQYVFQSGYCDVNDWLWNVLGALCGYGLTAIISISEIDKKN